MQDSHLILSLLVFTVTVSGCTGGGQGTESQGNKAVAVEQLQVTPSEIFADGTVKVRMVVRNVGELPAEVRVGSNDNGGLDGSDVLTNHCPDIFDISDFSASSSNVSGTQSAYTLSPDYRIRMNWELTQDTGNVPLNGYDCNLRFQVPFDYSVNAFRQLQVKSNSEVQGSEELSAKSSKGPMKIEIQAIGSSAPRGAPTFLEGDEGDVRIQLENKKPSEESSYTGLVELDPPKVESSNVGFVNQCPSSDDVPENGKIRIYEGKSKIFACQLDWELTQGGTQVPSIRGRVSAEADYTYVKDIGSRSVKVKYRGN